MYFKDVVSITGADLQRLVDDEVHETNTLEFKIKLPGVTGDDKKEFLYDVSAFGNTNGGFILFGVEDRDGVAVSLPGVEITNLDAETLRLENLLRDGVSPRLTCKIIAIKLDHERYVLAIQVLDGWNKPHMVTLSGTNKFYARNAAGKYLLEVEQIRKLVLDADGRANTLKRIREERVTKILLNETPVPMEATGKVVLHIIPQSASSDRSVPVENYFNRTAEVQPMGTSGWNDLINFDGFLAYSGSHEEGGLSYSYVQLFRNGMIEAVDGGLLDGGGVPPTALEKIILESISKYWKTFRELNSGIGGYVSITVTGVKGMTMQVSPVRLTRRNNKPLDRNVLVLPDILVDGDTPEFDRVFRGSFDLLWQAWGFGGSDGYGADGKWRERH